MKRKSLILICLILQLIISVVIIGNTSALAANTAPEIMSIPLTITEEGYSYTYQVTAEDPDGDELIYSLEESPEGMLIDSDSGLISWTPTGIQAGTYEIIVKVVDNQGGEDTQIYRLFVAEGINNEPEIISEPVIEGTEGEEYLYQVEALDGDNNQLIYRLLEYPEGMNIDEVTGEIKWFPAYTASGEHRVQVKVLDGRGGEDQQGFTVNIEEKINVSPVISSTPIRECLEGDLYTYTVEAEDADGDVLTYVLLEYPEGMTVDSSTGLINWFTDSTSAGEYIIIVQVKDPGGRFDIQKYLLIVRENINNDPVIISIPVNTAKEGERYTYNVEAEDTDNDILTYSLNKFPERMIIDENSGLIEWTPGSRDSGEYEIEILVSDGRGGSTSQVYSLIVEETENNPPVITSTPLLTIKEEEEYIYTVEAEDPDGDELIYSLKETPEGMSIHESSGEIYWLPQRGVAGPHNVLIEVTDGRGGTAAQAYTLIVESINNPPQIKGLEEISREGTVITYLVEALDPDGDILTYTLTEAPEEMIIDAESGIISWDIENVETGEYVLKISAADPYGGTAEAEFTLVISKNTSPEIISDPVIEGKVGEEYVYAVVAVDEDGDILTYTLIESPEGMSIDSSTGLISWLPTEEQVGEHQVEIRVEDGRGGFAPQKFGIIVELSQNHKPVITSTPVYNAKVGIEYIYQVIAEDPDNDLLIYSLSEYPEGMSIDSSTGLISWIPTESQTGTKYVLVEASDGKGGIATQAYTIHISNDEGDIDNIRPIVNIELSGEYIAVGSFAVIKLTSSDNIGVVSEKLKINGEEITLDENGETIYQSNVAAVFVVEGFAEDAAGNRGYDRKELTFLTQSGDNTPPIVEITTPEINSILCMPVNIVGTVTDDTELLLYTLEYSSAGKNEYHEFARGESPVANNILGHFDPTQLKNGYYDVRLKALDSAGNQRSLTTTYKVESQLKIGNFSISFNDLTIPVSGIPIIINRTYDSRDRSSGDFGHGWNLDIMDITVEESIEPYENWNYYEQLEQIHPVLPPVNVYYLEETKEHKVIINYPDGRVDEFKMVLNPARKEIMPISQTMVEYEAINGTSSNLEAISNDLVIPLSDSGSESGNVVLVDTSLEFYNPDRYKLTQADGTVLIINQNSGIEKIIDTNGNEIIFDENGITHSAGKSVQFIRDSEGRITCIIDPAGNTFNYTYDYYGDLISVKNQEGYISSFTYNSSHGLIDIIDPRGIRAVRNEYDENGRLTAHIDADGNRIEYTHSIGDRQEIIKDRRGNMTVYDYDADGNILQETDPLGYVKKYTYDADGNKTSETDALGNTSKYTYDEKGNLLTETDPLGNTYIYTYDNKGNVLSITDPLSNVSTNEYDEKGNLIKDLDPEGNTTTYSYDSAGNMTARIDPLGNQTTYIYDWSGNLVSETDPAGNTTTYSYDTNGNQTSMTINRTSSTGPETLTTYYQYDSMNRLIKNIYPNGSSTAIEYNSIGKKSAEIDRSGRRTEYEYDNAGNAIRTIYPDGTEETFTFDVEGNRISSTDRSGRTTEYKYDALGKLTKTIYPDGTNTETVYDPVGRIKEVIDGRGNKTIYTYNAAGNFSSVTDALGNTIEYEYNERNQLVQIKDPEGNITKYEYNKLGLRTKTIFPDGSTHCVEYDALANKISETDQAGVITRFEYDELNRLVRVIDALGNETVYTYDEAENILSETDGNGNTTTYEYNQLGQRVKRILPLGMEETYDYDEKGNLLSVTDFMGNKITYNYDINNRMIKKTFPDGSSESYTYTANGNKDSVTTTEGTTSYEYDDRGRLIRQVNPDGSKLLYTYDLEGNRTSVTTPSGITSYTYDELNRLKIVTDPDGQTTTYVYDANGNRSSITYPNGTIMEYSYDSLNRLTELLNKRTDGTIISSYKYTLGPVGNRLKVEENNGRIVEYEYDVLYRLIKERISDPLEGYSTISYSYDAVGNRLSRTVDGVSTSYTYDGNNRLITEGETIYSYDDNGNTIRKINSDGTTSYFYDYQNRLIKVNTVDSSIEYEYITSGIRNKATVDGNTITYLVDENRDYAQVLEERDGNKNLLVSYIYGDDLISQQRSTGKSYFHYDGLGSTRALSNNSGVITDTYIYDAFGEILEHSGDTENNYLYTGEQYDPNLGFYYLRARYMNPATGRFITKDIFSGSIYDPGSLHKYLYANQDPVNNIDPSGLFTLCSILSRITITSSLNSFRISYNMMMVKNLVDIKSIANSILRTAYDKQNLSMALLMKGCYNPIVFDLYQLGKDEEVTAYNAMSKAITSNLRSFLYQQMIPLKIKIMNMEFRLDKFIKSIVDGKDIEEVFLGNMPSLPELGILKNILVYSGSFVDVIKDEPNNTELIRATERVLVDFIKDLITHLLK